jgi:calcineurin-like phosphoesterase family protein
MLKLNVKDEDIYFCSDTHFLHFKNIEYSGRPFKTIEEHDNTLINNINSVVSPSQHLFILGDMIFTSNLEIIRDYYNRINGIKYLILGNHDVQNRMYRDSVKEIFEGRVYDSLILSLYKDIYYLSHFPYQYFTGYNLHGHIHSGPNTHGTGKLPFKPKRYDCGVDNNLYYPISLGQIKVELNKLEGYKFII